MRSLHWDCRILALLRKERCRVACFPYRLLEKAKGQIAKQWRLERDIVAQVENVVHLLASSKKWAVKDGQILFYDNSELDQFNQFMAKVQAIVVEQQSIQGEAFANVNKEIDNAKNALRP